MFNVFANAPPSASNFLSFSRSLDQFYVTVGQNNFGNKILSFQYFREIIGCKSPFLLQGPHFSPTLP
jgi:hypothetical protein